MYTYERSDLFRTQMAELWTGPKAAVPLLSGHAVSTARERPCARVPTDVCARPRVCPRVRANVPVCSHACPHPCPHACARAHPRARAGAGARPCAPTRSSPCARRCAPARTRTCPCVPAKITTGPNQLQHYNKKKEMEMFTNQMTN